MEKTLFEHIIAGDIPADVVYEDDLCLAFLDISPQAPVHVLLVPKKPLPKLGDAQSIDQALLGHLMLKAPEIAKSQGLDDFRLVVNHGAGAGQTVFHLHLHILGGRDLSWPPG